MCPADFGSSLPSYIDAAKQMTSSGLSPLGDLLGLFDSPEESGSDPHSSEAAGSSAHRVDTPTDDGLSTRSRGGMAESAPHECAAAVQLRADRTGSASGQARAAPAGQDGHEAELSKQVALAPGGTSPPLVLPERSSGLHSNSSWGPFYSSQESEGHMPVPGLRAAQEPLIGDLDSLEQGSSASGGDQTAPGRRDADAAWASPNQHPPPSPFREGGALPGRAAGEGGTDGSRPGQAASAQKLGLDERQKAVADWDGLIHLGKPCEQMEQQPQPTDALKSDKGLDSLISWSSFRAPE
jgi:hypothetical protein